MENNEHEKLDHESLVTVYKTGNEAIISLIKSILDEAEIKYMIAGEGVQGLVGVGVFGTGYNPITGPAVIKVMPEDAEYAKELLKDIEEKPDDSEEETGEEDN